MVRCGRWHHGPQWHAVHSGIYGLNNRIAFLEANPEIDDGYKAPIITGKRADIRGCRRRSSRRDGAGVRRAATAAGPFTFR